MEKNLEFDTGTELLDEHDLHDVLNRLPEAFDLFNGPSCPPPSSPVLHPTASMAEWLKAWDTLAMMKLWRREVVSSASMAEWLRAWDTLAMMKLWRREVVSSSPDRGTIVG